MFLTMVGNAVWGQSGSSPDSPITGDNITTAITPTEGGTVYLKDAKINVSNDYALDLSDTHSFTLNISGVCELRGADDIALYLPIEGNGKDNRTLTITGNGLLRIYGMACEKDKSGNVEVKGCTVYFLGDVGHGDGSENHGTFDLQEGGIAFVEGDITQTKGDKSGILFERPTPGEGTWMGELLFPENPEEGENEIHIGTIIDGDIDGDAETADDHIDLDLNGGTLYLDEGGKIMAQDINGENQINIHDGYISAYTVNYVANHTNTTGIVPRDYWLYGPNMNYVVLEGTIDCNQTANTHQLLGWINTGLEETANVLTTGDETKTPSAVPTPQAITTSYRGETVEMQGVWAAETRTIVVTKGVVMPNDVVLLKSPTDANFYYDEITESNLPDGITFTASTGTFSGTPSESIEVKDYVVEVPIKINGNDSEYKATVTISVGDNKPDLSDENTTIEWNADGSGTKIYSGDEWSLDDFVTIKTGNRTDIPLEDGRHYKVTYVYISDLTSEDFTDASTPTEGKIKAAGKYKVTKIEHVEGVTENI